MFSCLRSASLCSKVAMSASKRTTFPKSHISSLLIWAPGTQEPKPSRVPTLPTVHLVSWSLLSTTAWVEVRGGYYPQGFQGWLTCPLLLFLDSPVSNKKPRHDQGRQKWDGAGVKRGEWADSSPAPAPSSWAPALPPREMESSSQDKTWQGDFRVSLHLYSHGKAGDTSQKLSHQLLFSVLQVSDNLLYELKNHSPTVIGNLSLDLMIVFEPA